MVESKIIKIGDDQVICSTTLFEIKNIDLQLNVFFIRRDNFKETYFS